MARSGYLASALCAVALGCAVTTPAPVYADAPPTSKDALPPPGHVAPAKPRPKKAKVAKRTRRSAAQAHITALDNAPETPAVRYAQLSQDDCEAELIRRDVDFVREDVIGVVAPVRVNGALHGVVFRTDGKETDRTVSPYEIADCRLVLALDDFAEILARHDIVEVRHYSMYRPPHGWPEGKIGGQHNGGLALDAGRFLTRDGKTLDVLRDFHGSIGAKTCGDGAGPRPSSPDALELRAILCEAVDRQLFNVVLTPNYNRPHRNHFHLEVMAGVRWFLVH